MSEMESVVVEINEQSVSNTSFVDREHFDAELQKYYSGLSTENKKTQWTSEKIQNVIQMIEEYNLAKSLGKRPSDKQYYNAKKYDIMNIGDEKVLILKRKSHSNPTIRIVPSAEFYQRIHDAHIETGHGRRDKIIYALKDKYLVPIWAINIFLKLCKTCLSKKSFPKHGIVVKPLISDDFNRRGQVDLVDFQSSPDNDYKWLLQYQDHLTKFCFLRPLKSKEAKEVAIEILKIFLEVGCPNILQSDNGREFTAAVLKEIVSLWPSCKIINGRPRYPQSQDSIGRSNQDVKNMIRAWMVDNNSTNWSIGCYFAQFHKNSSFHSTIQRTPFKALFGYDPRSGLTSTHLSKNIITKLETEEDLERFLEGTNKENDNLHNLDTRKTDKQEEVAKDDNEIQLIASSNFNLPLNTHTPINAIHPEILKMNESENAPIPTGNSEIIILDQAIVSIHDTLNTSVINEEITISNTTVNISKTNEKEEIPVVDSEITIPNNCDIISTEIAENPSTSLCHICNLKTSGTIRCQRCNGVIHVMCGVSSEDEGSSWQLICNLCANENSISRERRESHQNLKRAADKMITLSSKKFKDIDIGTTVLVEVPKVDRRPLDSKNIVGKILEKRNELFRVGTPFGIISDWIPRNAVLSLPNTIISGDIPQITLPLRAIAAKCSSFDGQGIKQCNCKDFKNKQCSADLFRVQSTSSTNEDNSTATSHNSKSNSVLKDVEDIIANVYNYLQTEYEELKSSIGDSCDLSPLANILKRTASATRVSEDAIRDILDERHQKRAADCERDTDAKRAKLTHDHEDGHVSPITDEESNSEVEEQDDDNEPAEDDSQQNVEFEIETLKVEIEDEEPEYKPDPLQLQLSDIELTKEWTTEKQTITPRKKTNAQLCREYRERKRSLTTRPTGHTVSGVQNLISRINMINNTPNVSNTHIEITSAAQVIVHPQSSDGVLRVMSVDSVMPLATVKTEPVDGPTDSDVACSSSNTVCDVQCEPPDS